MRKIGGEIFYSCRAIPDIIVDRESKSRPILPQLKLMNSCQKPPKIPQ
jgi:hypothetical protein